MSAIKYCATLNHSGEIEELLYEYVKFSWCNNEELQAQLHIGGNKCVTGTEFEIDERNSNLD